MAIYYIVLIGVLNQTGFAGGRVVVSLYALDLGASQFAVGVIVALYSLCPLLVSVAIGKFADRVSLRTPILVGSVGMIGLLLLPLLFPGLAVLYIMGIALGFVHQLFGIPLEAAVGGIGGPEKRARNYALLTMGWSIANFLGPLIAGFSIDYMGHLRVFPLLAAIIAVPTLIPWFMPKLFPVSSGHHKRESHASVMDLWRTPDLRVTFLAGGIIGSAQDLFQFYFPIYGHALGLSASAIGTILGMVAAAAFAIRAFVPFLLRKFKESDVLLYSIIVSAMAYTLLPFFSNPYALAAIASVLGLGVGCAQPMVMSLIYLLAPPGRTAEALGLYRTVRSASHVVVPIVFGSMGSAFGFAPVFLSNSALLGVSAHLMRKAHLPGKS